MAAVAVADEVAVAADEVAEVLAAEVADLVAGLAAAECRDHRHRLAARLRLVDLRLDRAEAEVFRDLLAVSAVQAAHVRVALAVRDRSRGHLV